MGIYIICGASIYFSFLPQVGDFSALLQIYIAPSKALVQEKLRDWNQKFGAWGINCLELTGDNDSYNTRNIQEADIILTTPEVHGCFLTLPSCL